MKRGKPLAIYVQIAYLYELIPTSADDDRVGRVGAEADARDPFSVPLVGDGIFAVSQCVPQLNCSITRTGDDLAIVGGKRNGKDIVGVANETTGCSTS